jgi:diguanylate cyclase (GGDEF)-like protein
VPRILLIPLEGSDLPTWSLRGFTLEAASDESDGLSRLMGQPFDAAVLVATKGRSRAPELCAQLESACGQDLIPLLLAAPARQVLPTEPLESLAFDAFIDLTWEAALVEQCLSLVIARVRAGRGVAAIQHQVLGAVRKEVARLKDLTLRDELTGLYNLRFFHEVLTREHQRCQRYCRPYAVVYFDLDNLRDINNRHGHAAGTRALERIGLTLASTTRDSDYAFRIGGDEFATLLAECNRASALIYAERICSALRGCVLVEEGARIPITTSAGVAAFPDDGDSLETVLSIADALLFRAKSLGRDRAVTRQANARGGLR